MHFKEIIVVHTIIYQLGLIYFYKFRIKTKIVILLYLNQGETMKVKTKNKTYDYEHYTQINVLNPKAELNRLKGQAYLKGLTYSQHITNILSEYLAKNPNV